MKQKNVVEEDINDGLEDVEHGLIDIIDYI